MTAPPRKWQPEPADTWKMESEASRSSCALNGAGSHPKSDVATGDPSRTALEHERRLAALGTLTASICHELNNILTPVLSYAQMAEKTPNDTEFVSRALRRCADGVARATRMSSMILNLARPRPGSTPEIADVSICLSDALACIGRPLDEVAHVDVLVDDGCTAGIDPICLEQVLVNLLMNARRAVRDGGVISVRASADRSTGNTPTAVIEVQDSGPGVPPEVLATAFQPFGVPGASGTGLGLSICRRIIEAAGGEISAESKVGKGTRVTLRLPLAA
jgi:signal transduction histidine kinase